MKERVDEIDNMLALAEMHTLVQPWAGWRWPSERARFLKEVYNPVVTQLMAERDKLIEEWLCSLAGGVL